MDAPRAAHDHGRRPAAAVRGRAGRRAGRPLLNRPPSRTAPSESTDDSLAGVLGHAVRSTRHRLGLTVEALAQRSGVSTGALSQLERGQANPSLQTVQRLATALGLPVTQLLEAAPPADHLVVRADARPLLPAPDDVPPGEAAVRELLTPAGGRLQVIRTEVPPGASNEAGPYRHLGQECVVVLEGCLTVGIGGETLELDPGDAITYDCTVPHWWANRTDRTTVVIGAVTPLAF